MPIWRKVVRIWACKACRHLNIVSIGIFTCAELYRCVREASKARGAVMKKISFWVCGTILLSCGCISSYEQLVDPAVFVGERASADLRELPLSDVFARYDRTGTSIGKSILTSQVPLVDPVCIANRATAIGKLAGAADRRAQIRKLLGETEAGMKELVEYAGGANLYSEIANPFYLPEWRYFLPGIFAYLNDTPRVLDSGVALSASWKGVVLFNALAVSGIFSEFIASKFMGCGDFSFKMAFKNGPGSIITRHIPYRTVADDELLSPAALVRFGSLSYVDKVDLFSAMYYEKGAGLSIDPRNRTQKSEVVALLAAGLYTGWVDYVQMASLKEAISDLNDIWKKMGMVHAPLCKVARIISVAHELVGHLESCNELYFSQKVYDALKHLEAKSPRLYEILSTETFAAESDVYSRGRVLVAHRWLLEEWESFKELCTVIGELDAIVSWGVVVAEEPGSWCVPQVADQLVLQGLRHPVLSLECDSGQDMVGAPLTVITGPNGSGKTTALEAVALAAVLHQTWGIIPAERARMPIYDTIATSLRALGTVVSGKSRFQAQLEQLDKLYDTIKTAQGAVLTLVDEPLNGTLQEAAGKRIVEWCTKCISCGTATIMLATHSAEPTKIEKAVLLQPEVVEVAPGNFVRTFKLIPGAASWWFSDIARRDRFIVWLARLEGRI